MPLDLKLETTQGPAFVDSTQIDLVSAPFRKAGQPPVFCVGLRSGQKVYPLENKTNMDALRASKAVSDLALLPASAGAQAMPKRGRGRPKKEQPADKPAGGKSDQVTSAT